MTPRLFEDSGGPIVSWLVRLAKGLPQTQLSAAMGIMHSRPLPNGCLPGRMIRTYEQKDLDKHIGE